jgi:hypothetical protein
VSELVYFCHQHDRWSDARDKCQQAGHTVTAETFEVALLNLLEYIREDLVSRQ